MSDKEYQNPVGRIAQRKLPHFYSEGAFDPKDITVHQIGHVGDNRKYAVRIEGMAILAVTEEQWKEIEIAVRAGIIGLREFGTNAPK